MIIHNAFSKKLEKMYVVFIKTLVISKYKNLIMKIKKMIIKIQIPKLFLTLMYQQITDR